MLTSFYILLIVLAGAIVAALRKKAAIGGWLFYFFFALFADFSTVPFTIQETLSLLNPNHWPVKSQYHWYVPESK